MTETLLVDIGNSFLKYQYRQQVITQALALCDIAKLPQVDAVCIASALTNNPLLDDFQQCFKQVTVVKTAKQHHHLINGYDDFTALGVDRWLTLIAAYEIYPKQTVLIIDVGSAITFDLLRDDGKHQGGWIMPGLNWLKNSHTAFMGDAIENNDMLATNTHQAWHNGCRLMAFNGITAQVNRLCKVYPTMQVIITGGGVKSLLTKHNDFQFDYQQYDNLVLSGLNIWHNEYIK